MTIWYWIEFFPPTTGMLKSQLVGMYVFIYVLQELLDYSIALRKLQKLYNLYHIVCTFSMFLVLLHTTTLLPCAIIVIFKVTIIFPTRVENGTTVLIRF